MNALQPDTRVHTLACIFKIHPVHHKDKIQCYTQYGAGLIIQVYEQIVSLDDPRLTARTNV